MEKKHSLPVFELGKELRRFEGESFYIAEHEYAMLFHVYNSMDIIVKPNQQSCFNALLSVIDSKEEYESYDAEDKERYDLFVSALGYIMTCPLYAFTDGEMLFNIASCVIENLEKTYEKLMNVPLQAVDAAADVEFEQTIMAINKLEELSQSKK